MSQQNASTPRKIKGPLMSFSSLGIYVLDNGKNFKKNAFLKQ